MVVVEEWIQFVMGFGTRIGLALVCVLSALVVVSCSSAKTPSKKDLIKNFYLMEAAVLVSPHHLRKAMMKGESDFTLVDLRSAEEYGNAHIRGAINIPAYSSPDKSAYGDIERIVGAFRELPQDQDIIVYCYSEPCMTGRKVGKLLAENGIFVRHLGIGWNEWRHHWTAWNHEHEWSETQVEDYISYGPSADAGMSSGSASRKGRLNACSADAEFGC